MLKKIISTKNNAARMLLLALIVTGAGINNIQADTEVNINRTPAVISVSAQGYYEAIPDQGSVSMGVTHESRSANTSQQYVSSKIRGFVNAVRAKNIKGLTIVTTNNNLSRSYEYIKGISKLKGYRANQTVRIEIANNNFSKDLSDVIDLATKYGINDIHNVQYALSKAKREKAISEAIKMASQNAKQRMEATRDSLGLTVIGVTNVSVHTNNHVPVYRHGGYRMEAMAADAAPKTQLEIGEQRITANVSITYEIKN